MLQLLTPKAQFFMNSSFANMDRQRTAMGRPTLDMHPADAEGHGLTDGQLVSIRNTEGEVTAVVRITDAVPQGVTALPGKWWSAPEATSAVANLLSPSSWSPGGQPAYNDTYVNVTAHTDEPLA